MAFSDADLATLADDFISVAGDEIMRPRAVERMRGGNAGFSHFHRATERLEVAPEIRKCLRCREDAVPHRSKCLRHLYEARMESAERNRRRGVPEWHPGSKGRPPLVVQRAALNESKVVSLEFLLAEALRERSALGRKIGQIKTELQAARRAARRSVAEACS